MPKKKKTEEATEEAVGTTADTPQKVAERPTKEMVKLVKMYRGDMEADVHPYEVGNYEVGGWSKSKPSE
jgi:hypothetical protein